MLPKIALIATVGAGMAIGLLWPTGQHTAARPNNAAGIELVIPRSDDHHYYADADVDGRSLHMMVDTGASETALTEADARQIGITPDPNQYQVIGDGASGMVRGQYVQLKSIDLGGIRQQDVKVVIVPGAGVSLLGQPFLEKVDEIVIRGGEMRLKMDRPS